MGRGYHRRSGRRTAARIVVSARGASGSGGTPARVAPISRHGAVRVHGARCPVPVAAYPGAPFDHPDTLSPGQGGFGVQLGVVECAVDGGSGHPQRGADVNVCSHLHGCPKSSARGSFSWWRGGGRCGCCGRRPFAWDLPWLRQGRGVSCTRVRACWMSGLVCTHPGNTRSPVQTSPDIDT